MQMAANGMQKLKKGDVLFREGDESDAMYVIKSGRIAITKAKGNSEVILAELKTGEMLGEMAFFDNKPRSAGAKALMETEIISLPFNALHAQFKNFPEWLRAMVRTVNSHLRDANMRIKALESTKDDTPEMFPPHTITRLCAIIALMGYKCGEKTPEGLVIPYNTLRNYTIQVFQQPTNKMQKMMEVLSGLGLMKVEDLGEGKIKVTVLKHDILSQFVDWYNNYLFSEESKRVTVIEKELPILRALIHAAKKEKADDKGLVKVSLTDLQNKSMQELGYLVSIAESDSLAEKQIIQEKQSGDGGQIFTKLKLQDLETITPFWEIVYALKKIPSRD